MKTGISGRARKPPVPTMGGLGMAPRHPKTNLYVVPQDNPFVVPGSIPQPHRVSKQLSHRSNSNKFGRSDSIGSQKRSLGQ